jgi:hypothetical protein
MGTGVGGKGRWWLPPSEASPSDIARRFGQLIAEKPILEDMRKGAALGVPGALGLFVDTPGLGTDNNMIMFIGAKAGQQISAKVGGDFVDISSSGVSIVGALTMLGCRAANQPRHSTPEWAST